MIRHTTVGVRLNLPSCRFASRCGGREKAYSSVTRKRVFERHLLLLREGFSDRRGRRSLQGWATNFKYATNHNFAFCILHFALCTLHFALPKGQAICRSLQLPPHNIALCIVNYVFCFLLCSSARSEYSLHFGLLMCDFYLLTKNKKSKIIHSVESNFLF